jgi:hypothetical protein
VADERTAKLAPGLSAVQRANCARMAASRSAGNGVSTTQPRISRAGLGQRAHVVGVQRGEPAGDALGPARRAQELPERMRRGGEAAGHPHAGWRPSWLIISPREAFLPPTVSTSVILRCSNGATRAVARGCRHGKAP